MGFEPGKGLEREEGEGAGLYEVVETGLEVDFVEEVVVAAKRRSLSPRDTGVARKATVEVGAVYVGLFAEVESEL
jgi:hypothetical protein